MKVFIHFSETSSVWIIHDIFLAVWLVSGRVNFGFVDRYPTSWYLHTGTPAPQVSGEILCATAVIDGAVQSAK